MSSQAAKENNYRTGLRPLDIATLAYLILEIIAVALFMHRWPGWSSLIVFYGAAVMLVLIFAFFPYPNPPKLWRIVRLIYPLALVTLLYEMLRPQIFMILHQPFDNAIYVFEKALSGHDIYFELQQYMTILLNELFSLSYMSYYLLMPLALILFIAAGRWRSLEQFVLSAATTFYICYVAFIIFPVMGPRFFLDDLFYLPLIGPIFTPLAQKIVHSGGLHGGAMPSSHCAVALVCVYYVVREFGRKAYLLWIVMIMLCLGTVYGRYHYVTDVLAGLIVGGISIILTRKWQYRFFMAIQDQDGFPKMECPEPVEAGIGDGHTGQRELS